MVPTSQCTTASNSPVMTTTSLGPYAWSQSVQYCEPETTITMDREQFARMFQPIEYLNLPLGLDMDHPAVQSAVADWYAALEQLQLKHNQLKVIARLSQNHE